MLIVFNVAPNIFIINISFTRVAFLGQNNCIVVPKKSKRITFR